MCRCSIPGGHHAGVGYTALARNIKRQGESGWGRLDYLVEALASGAAPSLSRFYYDHTELYEPEVGI